jgi:hypothetical protein
MGEPRSAAAIASAIARPLRLSRERPEQLEGSEQDPFFLVPQPELEEGLGVGDGESGRGAQRSLARTRSAFAKDALEKHGALLLRARHLSQDLCREDPAGLIVEDVRCTALDPGRPAASQVDELREAAGEPGLVSRRRRPLGARQPRGRPLVDGLRTRVGLHHLEGGEEDVRRGAGRHRLRRRHRPPAREHRVESARQRGLVADARGSETPERGDHHTPLGVARRLDEGGPRAVLRWDATEDARRLNPELDSLGVRRRRGGERLDREVTDVFLDLAEARTPEALPARFPNGQRWVVRSALEGRTQERRGPARSGPIRETSTDSDATLALGVERLEQRRHHARVRGPSERPGLRGEQGADDLGRTLRRRGRVAGLGRVRAEEGRDRLRRRLRFERPETEGRRSARLGIRVAQTRHQRRSGFVVVHTTQRPECAAASFGVSFSRELGQGARAASVGQRRDLGSRCLAGRRALAGARSRLGLGGRRRRLATGREESHREQGRAPHPHAWGANRVRTRRARGRKMECWCATWRGARATWWVSSEVSFDRRPPPAPPARGRGDVLWRGARWTVRARPGGARVGLFARDLVGLV